MTSLLAIHCNPEIKIVLADCISRLGFFSNTIFLGWILLQILGDFFLLIMDFIWYIKFLFWFYWCQMVSNIALLCIYLMYLIRCNKISWLWYILALIIQCFAAPVLASVCEKIQHVYIFAHQIGRIFLHETNIYHVNNVWQQ